MDPLAAAGNAGMTALVDAELAALAADPQALNDMLAAGDIVSARVLGSNGLTDLIAIAGRRVAAALPPNLRPGDSITVQVMGFDDGRITVQIVPDGTPHSVVPPAARPPAQPSEPRAASAAPAAVPRTGFQPPQPHAPMADIEARLATARAAVVESSP
ncbi:MAG: hypothetical protein ABR591_14395, partial [Candidatus Velthaea sp.]